eukprot:TRINITY_DN25603_c0_g1_i1.p1 TRINITY_DN25603_c0_g1~~TRINITY_DN25603_c0_g1_i1.p1  ORF type:complete len:452 (+),score=103.42 TRINITY_DN25603_c0_g1_i1:42-1358(+)
MNSADRVNGGWDDAVESTPANTPTSSRKRGRRSPPPHARAPSFDLEEFNELRIKRPKASPDRNNNLGDNNNSVNADTFLEIGDNDLLLRIISPTSLSSASGLRNCDDAKENSTSSKVRLKQRVPSHVMLPSIVSALPIRELVRRPSISSFSSSSSSGSSPVEENESDLNKKSRRRSRKLYEGDMTDRFSKLSLGVFEHDNCSRKNHTNLFEGDDSDDVLLDELSRPFKRLCSLLDIPEHSSMSVLGIGADAWALIISFVWTDYPRICGTSRFFAAKSLADAVSVQSQLIPTNPIRSSSDKLTFVYSLSNCCGLVHQGYLSYAVHLGLIGVIKAIRPQGPVLDAMMLQATIEGQLDVLKFAVDHLNGDLDVFQDQDIIATSNGDNPAIEYIRNALGLNSTPPRRLEIPSFERFGKFVDVTQIRSLGSDTESEDDMDSVW